MSELISVICPYHNDGDIILDSVGRLLNIPNVEIIVVDDGSIIPVTPLVAVPDNVRIIRLSRNLGVGAAFDRGVSEASGETILLMGCDVMVQEGWENHVRRLAAEHPKGIVAAACVGVTPDNGYEFVNPPRAGAEIRLKQEAKSRDKWYAERNYNDILVGAWLDPSPAEFTKCGCLMGAAYVINKRWFTHIGGFKGHRYWGGLEPLISVKSWLAGGYVATDPSWVIGHVFERNPLSRRSGRIDWGYYNKLLISYTCFPKLNKELDKFLGNAYAIGVARQYFKEHRAEIERIKEYNQSIFTEDESICYHSDIQ
jgi:glycosyltransferase involved in cell wall biosynthesis